MVDLRRPSTKAGAYKIYKAYKDLNPDVDETLLEQMVVFAVARRATKAALCELFDYEFNSTPYYHTAWYYWKAFETAGLEDYWQEFVTHRNENGDTKKCLIQLEKELGEESPRIITLRRRLMITSGTLARSLHTGCVLGTSEYPPSLWTKGGAWSSFCPMTWIILLKQHLPLRKCNRSYQTTLASNPEALSLLETALSSTVDPDTAIASEVKQQAVLYVKHEMPKLLNWKKKKSSIYAVSWFFQRPIPQVNGYWYNWETRQHRPRRDRSKLNDFIWW